MLWLATPTLLTIYLNNRVFLSRNYRLIVAPRKFDVLETNISPRSEASRANKLVFRTSNFRGPTIRPIVPRHMALYCLYCSPLNFLLLFFDILSFVFLSSTTSPVLLALNYYFIGYLFQYKSLIHLWFQQSELSWYNRENMSCIIHDVLMVINISIVPSKILYTQ